MIALLDYGAGNLRSVFKALTHVGADVRLVTRPEELSSAQAVVLPGVGAFDDCLNSMHRQELFLAAREFIKTGRPFLGICVGYQALFEKSEEFNSCAVGLGVFGGRVVRFPPQHGLKVPQIGWNRVHFSSQIALSTKASRIKPTFISCTAFFRSLPMFRLLPRRRITGRHLPPQFGGIMCSRHNSILKKPTSGPATSSELYCLG